MTSLKAGARLHGKFWYKCHMYPEICDSRCESVMFHVAFIRVLLRNKLTFPECPSAVIKHQIQCAQQGGCLLGFIFLIIIFK